VNVPIGSLSEETHSLAGLDELPSPRLLVYRRLVEQNLALMRAYLEDVSPACGLANLRPHVKTHKATWAAQLQMAAGVEKFKCTPNELDMLLEAGAQDIFVAYPLLPWDARRLADRVRRFPHVRLAAQVGCIEHAETLAQAAREQDVRIDCYLDLDVGNGRTGMPPSEAPALAQTFRSSPRLEALRVIGLHAYDGHNRSPDPAERAACARGCMDAVVSCLRQLEALGFRDLRLVASGSPGFLPCLRDLLVRHQVDAEVDASPGTWIYWDSGYDRILPGQFEIAAVVLAQVMDRPAGDLVTLNLGHKRWAIDQGPVEVFSVPGLEVLRTSEEHTVLRVPSERSLSIGDRVLIAPKHVCSTVNLWEEFTLVGNGGEIEAASLPVTARNR
jgi:D-serine deaminase-like pyridoxal phosphate-dependent protein